MDRPARWINQRPVKLPATPPGMQPGRRLERLQEKQPVSWLGQWSEQRAWPWDSPPEPASRLPAGRLPRRKQDSAASHDVTCDGA